MESPEVAVSDPEVEVRTKMQYKGKILKTSLAGAVVDIGVGTPAVIHISQLISPTDEAIKRVEDVLQTGQEINVWVKRVKDGRVELTMIKPLDLEWRELKKGMTVKGIVVRLEKFGAFVEIGAERPGLVHISEMAHGYVRAPGDVVKEGDEIECQVLEVNRRKKQIKLSMKALQPEPVKEEEPAKPSRVADFQQPRERAVRKPKKAAPRKGRDESSAELLLALKSESDGTVEETALGMALREAMEKAKSRKG